MCKSCGRKTRQEYEQNNQPSATNPRHLKETNRSHKPPADRVERDVPQFAGLTSVRIDNLVINNHGVLNMFPTSTDTRGSGQKESHPLSGGDTAEQPMEIHAMDFKSNQNAIIQVQNTWPVKLSKVKLRHQYSDWSVDEHTFINVEPNSTTSADFSVKYQTGWGTGASTDSWWCEATFEESNVTFGSAEKWCMMRENDSTSSGPLTFKLEGNRFKIDLRSGGCDVELDQGDFGFNAFAFFRAKNSLPVEAVLEVSHKYSDDTGEQNSHWQGQSISPHSETAFTTAFYMTGPTHWAFDYFKVTAWPRYDPPANAPELANKSLSKDWDRFVLRDEDRGQCIEANINCWGYYLKAPSGVVNFDWDRTPAGYNTVAWVQIKNDFVQDIRYLVLKHRYSTDAVYEFDFEDIPSKSLSSEKYMVEYFTGATHPGFDYWDVTVFLKDGEYWTNKTSAKECYLERQDAHELTFTVSEDNFKIGLSDGCNDGMSSQGKVDYLLGADINRPYSWNCFLAAHNAFATEADGSWAINNQALSLSNQLARGATTLLLDIHWVDNDIWMLHAANEAHNYLVNRPWNHHETLKSGLKTIARFLNRFQDSVVTIVFEDKLGDDNGSQHDVLKKQFEDVELWDKIFFPTEEMKTDASKWPSLSTLRSQNKHLLCFTSKQNSNLPYQWDYMTENVYGKDSLNSNTWTNKRDESKDIGSLATFAMNHFPSIQIGNFAGIIDLLNDAKKDNQESSLKEHIDACIRNKHVVPNWLNLDYIDVGWCTLATAYCNEKIKSQHSVRVAAHAIDDGKSSKVKYDLVESRFVSRYEIFPVEESPFEEVGGVGEVKADDTESEWSHRHDSVK